MVDDEPSKRLLPFDFSTRCVFRIESELTDALVYGSRVRLIHHATECKLVATKVVDPSITFHKSTQDDANNLKKKRRSKKIIEIEDGTSNRLQCISLVTSSKMSKNNDDIWVVASRYKMREEGESIYVVRTY
jgi:hypothetical protein